MKETFKRAGAVCRTCNYRKGDACVRYPQPLTFSVDVNSYRCGEWSQFIWWDEDDVKPRIDPKVLEANDWLLDVPNHEFIKPYEFKKHWSYAAHVVAFFLDIEIYGPRGATRMFSLAWFASRTSLLRPYTPKAKHRIEMQARCRWIIDHLFTIFPFESDHTKAVFQWLIDMSFIEIDSENKEG